MEHRNLTAAKGIKLIRTAKILSVIAAILTVVGGVAALSGAMVAGGSAMENGSVALGALGVAGVGGILAIAGMVIALVSLIMELVGLSKAGPAHANYKTAMLMVLVNFVLGIVAFFVSGNMILSAILRAAAPILVFLSVYFVLSGTIALLREKNDASTATKGSTVRMIFLVCTAVNVLGILVSACPALSGTTGLMGIAMTIGSVVQIVALFLYISFLGRSVQSLTK